MLKCWTTSATLWRNKPRAGSNEPRRWVLGRRFQMSGRFVDSTMVMAIATAALSLMPVSVAGQVDIQGFWANQGRRLATYDVEKGANETHVLMSGNPTDPQSLIVD